MQQSDQKTIWIKVYVDTYPVKWLIPGRMPVVAKYAFTLTREREVDCVVLEVRCYKVKGTLRNKLLQ